MEAIKVFNDIAQITGNITQKTCDTLQKLKGLKGILLKANRQITGQGLLLLKNMKKLNISIIGGAEKLTAAGLKSLLKNGDVESLTLRGCPHISPNAFVWDGYGPHLLNLTTDQLVFSSEKAFEQFTKNAHMLGLRVDDIRGITPEQFGKHIGNFKIYNLSCNDSFNREFLPHLSELPKLMDLTYTGQNATWLGRFLQVRDMDSVTLINHDFRNPEVINALYSAKGHSVLGKQHFIIYLNQPKISSEQLRTLVKNFPEGRRITLTDCSLTDKQIGDVFFDEIDHHKDFLLTSTRQSKNWTTSRKWGTS